MTSNVGIGLSTAGSTFFPTASPAVPMAPSTPGAQDLAQRVNSVTGLTRAALRVLDRAALQQTLEELCAQLGGPSSAAVVGGDLHANGTARIPSLVAVWLIGQVSEAYAPGRKLVKLSQVQDVDVLRSIGGVANLLIRAIRRDME
ncbi:hypothetical protein [Blastococcus sp. TF02-09]|uniref:hypothetical protein n=1 Tax=Blastococcus sp. TF02-09 TaxID=2250576 RepID=UPI0011BF10FE|nr:hypothetical protein [Blastococcus sp. TF02-9]